jgi:hypothetical protein
MLVGRHTHRSTTHTQVQHPPSSSLFFALSLLTSTLFSPFCQVIPHQIPLLGIRIPPLRMFWRLRRSFIRLQNIRRGGIRIPRRGIWWGITWQNGEKSVDVRSDSAKKSEEEGGCCTWVCVVLRCVCRPTNIPVEVQRSEFLRHRFSEDGICVG